MVLPSLHWNACLGIALFTSLVVTSSARATVLSERITIQTTTIISQTGGHEADTRTNARPYIATATLTLTPSSASGLVQTVNSPGAVLTTSTAVYPLSIATSLDTLLASFNHHLGKLTTEAEATVTDTYVSYAANPTASYGFENVVFTSETNNAVCDGTHCYGFDEVVQITVPGISPRSPGQVTPATFDSIGAIFAAADHNGLPITFSAYAKDYDLTSRADGSIFNALDGIALAGIVTTIPEPSAAAVLATATLLAAGLMRRRSA